MATISCPNTEEYHVEIRHGLANKGKGLFATKNFQEGDIIFSERPLVSCQFVWNAIYKYAACDHCMRSLETAQDMCRRLTRNNNIELPHPDSCPTRIEEHVTCHQCTTMYCSEECRQLAWNQYHQVLCFGSAAAEDVAHPLCRLLEAWRTMHYPPETCSIMLIARMIATVKQSSDKASVVSTFSQFCRTTVNEEESIAHKLLGVQFQDQLDMLRSLVTELLHEDDVQQWLTPDGFRSLFALIGTNGQGIGTSSFSVWVKNCEALQLGEDEERQKLNDFIDKLYADMDSESGDFLNCEGSGLYRLQSTCNHSCCPNAEVTFPNNNFVLSVKALTDINQGDEIFISYIDECALDRSRHSRQKILRENYLFVCQCEKCTSQLDDPDMTSEEEEDSMDDD